MKVLMFGWEFPPYSSGGLGSACYLLTKGLAKKGIAITFVVPYGDNNETEYVKLIGVNDIKNLQIKFVNSILQEYMTNDSYDTKLKKLKERLKYLYGEDLYHEVYRFSHAALEVASKENFDVIHCHDWMTYPAGINAKHLTNKPLIVHIHNTVFDRSSLSPSNYEYEIEKAGFENSDCIIAISNKVKDTLVKKYGINEDKIKVVHWGIDHENKDYYQVQPKNSFSEKIVLFAGRITLQKGPDYFIEAAKKVLDFYPNVRFIVVGSGDMLPRIINRAIELGISHKVNFTGWFNQKELFRAFKIADLFVMPSVSEPFGLVALEALKNGSPVIVSKQSGVCEVIKNCLKVDFWDINELANKIVNVLKYISLHKELKENSQLEINDLDIYKPAKKIIGVYRQVLKW